MGLRIAHEITKTRTKYIAIFIVRSCRQSFCKHASLRTVQISRTCAQERCVPIPFARCPKYESHDKFARLLFDVHFVVAYRSRYIFNFPHHDTFHLSSHLSFLSFISLYVSLFTYISSCIQRQFWRNELAL